MLTREDYLRKLSVASFYVDELAMHDAEQRQTIQTLREALNNLLGHIDRIKYRDMAQLRLGLGIHDQAQRVLEETT